MQSTDLIFLLDHQSHACSTGVQVPQVAVVHSDLFKVKQLPQMLKAFQPADGAKLKVVANIPYNITSGGQAPLGY